MGNDLTDKNELDILKQMERAGGLNYDSESSSQNQETPKSLGKASFVNDIKVFPDIESPWKKLPLANLPSEGFGYPPGADLSIRSADVGEIKYFSTIDENDPIDIDDKINHILSKCCVFKWSDGPLNYMDIYQEDRFYIFMSIRDLTFIKGENRIFIPTLNDCKKEECPIPSEIELNSRVLSNFKLSEQIKKYYDNENGCFNLIPKNGDSPIQLFIPTIGTSTKIRRILREKTQKNKKYDVVFAQISPYIIANWRDLDESTYDNYERSSSEWTYTQFAIADSISKEITFATKNNLSVICSKCSAEVTAPIRFRGGIRSLYVISDIFGQLL